MDYQNRIGSKKGGGGVASASESNSYRRERIKKLVSNQIDLDNDPYVFKNHLGLLECRLCLTTHNNPESFLSHSQGRKHQLNLQKRSILENKHQQQQDHQGISISNINKISKGNKIGKPGYKVMKIRHPISLEIGLLIKINYLQISPGDSPNYRFMNTFEQNIDLSKNSNYQYLVINADPYENIAFKIPSKEIYSERTTSDNDDNDKFWTFWDKDTKEFYIQFFYKNIT
ncbi:Splicing factor 3A subunit 2 [Wickerhamomyces ciferrii]|uniref:Splicing factor 3A subunit 2 n=1 Tax=Wickerhamomyces ciferrii (strain ATCC 14091 / BCRC 22168 / CBS 111 / JCM 3599 / NBRC 0793 / NRRL Y-1031 F-60-10) TaxID=1206466 RepID=K0KSE5_WICCF|nr:Splicing factor 3A subunit 2 [Wickerhamomyces ciferrii]CCH44942.1 Splicing factor 3A subunit 2 [Wickerhamomyces ciferrii]